MNHLISGRALVIAAALFMLTACSTPLYHEPLKDASIRPVLLGFGKYVTPDPSINPIDPPERFIGYHVGADFEVTNAELTEDVPVFAICDGTVSYSGFASGYGGLVVERCVIRKKEVSVLYGHLTLDSLVKDGSTLKKGDAIATLAAPQSHDSDGNRKHLHLGIHIGTETDDRGYVQTPEEMGEFIDPLSILPWRPAGTGGLLKPYWKQ